MMFDGLQMIRKPVETWQAMARPEGHSPTWLPVAAIVAATIPAVAVVLGHLGSHWLGYADRETALQRAAIGFVATVPGAVVMTAALALALLRICDDAKVSLSGTALPSAVMGLIAPAWFCGAVLAVPPLLQLGPGIGELLWFALALLCAIRVIRKAMADGLGVRRRWKTVFSVETGIAFALLFLAVPLLPAALMRHAVGVTGAVFSGDPAPMTWPVPEPADW